MRPAIPQRVRYLGRYLACMGLYGRRGYLLPGCSAPVIRQPGRAGRPGCLP